MRLKVVSAVLAVAGGVWMLYLFLSFSQVQYSAFPITEPFYVKCNPLGRPGITPPDLDDSLTPAQRQAVDTYVSKVHEENASENEALVRARAEQSILTYCDQARQNRLALLLFVASATTVLATTSFTRRRSTPAPTPAPAPQYTPPATY